MNDYIPQLATITEACEWLSAKTGEQWTMPRIVEAHVMPWIWLDYSPEAPPEVFGDRIEGFLAPFIFFNDCGRIAIDRQEALMTMTRLPDGRLIRFSPGLRFDLNEIRFKREDVIQLAEKQSSARPAGPTGALKIETPHERRARLKARKGELVSAGVKAWQKKLAEEEGVHQSRIKQLLADDKPENVEPMSMASQLRAARRR